MHNRVLPGKGFFMNENVTTQENVQEQTQNSQVKNSEPVIADNSDMTSIREISAQTDDSKDAKGESAQADPKAELILGKFKSVDDLSKAYEELQKHQGKSSEELGSLRKELAFFDNLKSLSSKVQDYRNSILPVIERDKKLYSEYFENRTFNEIYSEALMAYGDNLDTDRMISLIEAYVKTRIEAYDKNKFGKNETQQVLDSMTYSKNPKSSIVKPKKSLSEMSEEEFRESIRNLI